MKQKIKVLVLTEGCAPVISADGDWIDLRAAENFHLDAPRAEMLKKQNGNRYRKLIIPRGIIPLGVAMQLPKGMEAHVAPRSSVEKKLSILQGNSIGIIDQTYCGPEDQWGMPVRALGEVNIEKGDRVCQFRIAPSQKATLWQRIKWLLSSGVEIELVDHLDNPNREGFGHTGVK